MPAKIYSVPDELVMSQPEYADFLHNWDALRKAETEWVGKVQQWAKENSKSGDEIIGEIWRYPIADGYAQYVILNIKPLELIHLPIGDQWQIGDIVRRGLRVTDVRATIQRNKRLEELFSKKD